MEFQIKWLIFSMPNVIFGTYTKKNALFLSNSNLTGHLSLYPTNLSRQLWYKLNTENFSVKIAAMFKNSLFFAHRADDTKSIF